MYVLDIVTTVSSTLDVAHYSSHDSPSSTSLLDLQSSTYAQSHLIINATHLSANTSFK